MQKCNPLSKQTLSKMLDGKTICSVHIQYILLVMKSSWKRSFTFNQKKTGLHFLKSNFSSRSWFFRKKCFSVCQHFLLSIISFWLCITCKAHKFLCFEYAHLLRFALLKRILQELMNMSFAYSYRQIVIYKCFVCYQYVFSSLRKVLIQHFFALLIATIRTF